MAPTYCGDGTVAVPGRGNEPVDASNLQVWIGIGLSLFGAFLSVVGLNLQRASQVKNAAMSEEEQQSALSQPMNVLGGALMGFAALFDFVSFGFAPQSLLAPIGAVTLVLNMMLAPFTLGEKLSRQDIVSTAAVFTGIVIIIIFSDRETPEYSNEVLQCLYLRPVFIVYATTVAALLGMSLYGIQKLDQLNPPVGSKLFYVWRFCYPACAGTFGGGSVLFAKSFVELVKAQARGEPEFTHVGTYVVLIIMAVCLSTQIRYLNYGLKIFEALYVVPIYQVFWVLIGILGGSIYFNEFWDYSRTQWVMYILGAVLVVGGVLPLSSRKSEDGLATVGAIVAVEADEMRMRASTRAMSLASGCYSNSGRGEEPVPFLVGAGSLSLPRLDSDGDDGADSHLLAVGASSFGVESAAYSTVPSVDSDDERPMLRSLTTRKKGKLPIN